MLDLLFRVLKATSYFSCGQFALITAAESTVEPSWDHPATIFLLVVLAGLCFALSVTEYRADTRRSKRAGGRK